MFQVGSKSCPRPSFTSVNLDKEQKVREDVCLWELRAQSWSCAFFLSLYKRQNKHRVFRFRGFPHDCMTETKNPLQISIWLLWMKPHNGSRLIFFYWSGQEKHSNSWDKCWNVTFSCWSSVLLRLGSVHVPCPFTHLIYRPFPPKMNSSEYNHGQPPKPTPR